MRQSIKDLYDEMSYQNEVWGENRTQQLELWLTILTEEIGEIAKEILEKNDVQNLYHECIQVAAVAIHMAEDIERRSKAGGFNDFKNQ